jgi:hypothetical protein
MDKGGTPLSIYLQWEFIMVEQFGPRLPKLGYMMVLLGNWKNKHTPKEWYKNTF